MADRTLDTGTLDRDDAPVEPLDTERAPGPAVTEERTGKPDPEPKKSADEPEKSAEKPEKPEAAGEPSGEADEGDADAAVEEAPAPAAEDTAGKTEDAADEPPEKAEAAAGEAGGTAPDGSAAAAAGDEPGEAAEAAETAKPAEAEPSENTRTVALRVPEGAAAAAETVAIEVADMPRAEPPAIPATAQDVRDAQPAASPLDLLAHLTNTPPPPRTPARTFLRRARIWTLLVALLVPAVLAAQLLRPLPGPTLVLDPGASSFTVGGGTFTMPWPEKGQAAVKVVGSGTIGTFGEQKPVPTASVAKIMTAYVILREHPIGRDEPGPRVTVDARAVGEGKAVHESRIEGLRVGQTFSLQDMLKMLMIPSGNNVARLLARWNTGTRDETEFVRKMNEAARSLGMKNTTYTDPSGLDKGTVSTAVDQLKLAEAVMRFDTFRAIVAMPNADIPGVGRIINNNDRLILAGLSIRGIKTGSNTPAGGTLSWAAYKTVDGEERLILGTMLDQHVTGPDPNGSNSLLLVQDNSKKVVKAVREALTSATAVRKGQVVGHVDDGLGGRVPLVATRDLKVVGVPGQKLALSFRDGGRTVAAGAKAGTVVGELVLGGAKERRVPVALRSELREPSFRERLTRIG
ncbi:serine hydrolase [Streptomyces megasporus]|uniref:serine hydrolase n=1 Tax=Streptomyces megasporus TaxID=44060 RepID=UPI000997805B|nr:serine hydrolase [Streptomyces megasporus]